MSYFVYILKCSGNSYYTGVTNDISRRVEEHQIGSIKSYTSTRRPVKLIFYEEFSQIDEAIIFEKQVKRWRRAKKEALIDRQIEKLKALSRSYS